MKKMLLSIVAVLAISVTTNAQVTNLIINNNAGCDVDVILHAGSTGTCGAATPTATATTIPGYSSLTIANPQAVGFPIGVTLFQLVEAQGNPNCGTNNMSVYECTTGSQYSSGTSISLNPPGPCTCTPAVSITWTTSGTTGIIDIDP